MLPGEIGSTKAHVNQQMAKARAVLLVAKLLIADETNYLIATILNDGRVL